MDSVSHLCCSSCSNLPPKDEPETEWRRAFVDLASGNVHQKSRAPYGFVRRNGYLEVLTMLLLLQLLRQLLLVLGCTASALAPVADAEISAFALFRAASETMATCGGRPARATGAVHNRWESSRRSSRRATRRSARAALCSPLSPV